MRIGSHNVTATADPGAARSVGTAAAAKIPGSSAPYPELRRRLWKLLTESASAAAHLTFQPRPFVRPMSPVLKTIVREQIAAIGEPAIAAVRAELLRQAQDTIGSAVTNPEARVQQLRQVPVTETNAQLVHLLLARLFGGHAAVPVCRRPQVRRNDVPVIFIPVDVTRLADGRGPLTAR